MRKEVSRVLKESTIYGLGSLIPRAAGIVLTPIYTTYLTRADYGIMSLAMMVSSMIGTVMILGQNGSLVLYYRSTAVHAEERRELLFNVFWFVMLVGGVLTALGFLFGPHAAKSLTGSNQVSFYPYLAIALLVAYIGVPQALQQSINRAQRQAKLYTGLQLATFAINTGFTLYFVVALRQGAYGSLKGTLVATIAMAPVGIYVCVRRWTPKVSAAALKRSMRYGLPLVPHYFSAWVLTYIDRYLLLYLSNTAQVGLYSLAYNFSMILNLFCTAINQAWAPIYFDLAESEEGRRTLPRLTTIYAAVVTVLAIGYTLLAPDLLLLLANRNFHAAVPVVPVVAGGYFFFALYMVVSTPIFHARKTWWAPAISGAAAVVNAGLNLVLIPAYGMIGAAWATFVGYGCMALIARVVSNRLQPGLYESRKLALLVGIYGLAMGVSIGFIELHLPIWLDVTVKAVVFLVLIGLMIVVGLASVGEVRSFLRRRPPRPAPVVDEQTEAAESLRRAHEVGGTPDDTGLLQDDLRD
jgi:O-antigen/teichoic acid export membrane protein